MKKISLFAVVLGFLFLTVSYPQNLFSAESAEDIARPINFLATKEIKSIKASTDSGRDVSVIGRMEVISFFKPQEKRLVEGINQIIDFVDGIKSKTSNYKVESIEVHIGVDVKGNIFVGTIGSNEGIKVVLSR